MLRLIGFNSSVKISMARIQSGFSQDSATGVGKHFSMSILKSHAAIERAAFVYIFQFAVRLPHSCTGYSSFVYES